jgi:hypothetical protein
MIVIDTEILGGMPIIKGTRGAKLSWLRWRVLYPLPGVASLLNISEQLVDDQRKAWTIIAVRSGEGYGYPVCQFELDRMVPGLAEALD